METIKVKIEGIAPLLMNLFAVVTPGEKNRGRTKLLPRGLEIDNLIMILIVLSLSVFKK